MFPIRDTKQTQSFPIINYLIIASNIAVFIYMLQITNFEQFIQNYAFIPRNFDFFNLSAYTQIVTSMWLHGGLFHIASNMWFLHIFGDNVEDYLGSIPYLLFYIGAGVAAVFAQYFLNTTSQIPMVGASGAISGVTGMYFVIYRNARIEALVPTLFGFWDIIKLPAWFFLGYWFVLQVLSGFGTLGQLEQGGVAFFAHIGGFVFGYVVGLFMKTKEIM